MIFHAWSLYPFGALTWWWYWLIRLLVLAYWFCSSHDYPPHFDMYVHFVVSLIVLVLIILLLYYLDHIWACYPYCYSFWLSYSRLTCVWTWMIYLHSSWPLFSCVFVCCLFVWVAHLSSLPLTLWFRSFLSFQFSYWQVWGLVCTCFFD